MTIRSSRSSAARAGIPIIGIVGGIGAGKSEVARILQSLGCVVSSSDTEAKAVLDLPDVRSELVSWWGKKILDPNGSADRAAIASIVFSDPAERAKLEQLIHPRIHSRREQTIADAVRHGAKAVIVDAPLLFEAGVDKECDAVIFVETPEASRQQRVSETRGWGKDELARREASQLSLDEKKKRSTHVLTNDADLADLEKNTARLFSGILAACAGIARPERPV